MKIQSDKFIVKDVNNFRLYTQRKIVVDDLSTYGCQMKYDVICWP